MAAFIAKQMVGDKLSSVKGAVGGGDKEGGGDGEGKAVTEDGEDPEVAEARREMEEKRKDKHRKMEEEREEMRQSIRDKYGLKKKEVPVEEAAPDPMDEGRIGRKKLTPAEMAAANNPDSDDDEFAKFPTNLSELSSKVSDLPSKLAAGVGEVTQKCSLQ